MTDRPLRNILASLHQRLLKVSKQTGRPFSDLVMYYAIERFLYRLSMSQYANQIILKGGLMLHVWNTAITRVTRDIDVLGRLSNDLTQVKEAVQAVCATAVKDDGLVFDPQTVVTARIAEDADYEGVRATFKGQFGKVPLAMQVDFGFSDIITPQPTRITYPGVLDFPPATLLAYNRETVVAEKFEAMTKLGEVNSRMKDFFDVWVLSQGFAFDGALLADAVQSTFAHRKTEMEIKPACFTERFTKAPAKAVQWKAFLRTSRVGKSPADFAEVVGHVEGFLRPVAESLMSQKHHRQQWQPGGPWA